MAGLVLDMDWDISKAEAKQRKLQRDYDIAKKEIESKEIEIDLTSESIEKTKDKLKSLKTEFEEIRKENLIAIAQDKPIQQKETFSALRAKKAEIEKQNQLLVKQQALYRSQELSLKKQKSKIAEIGDQILLNSKKQNKFTQAFEKSQKSADRFGKRIKSLIASALFFSVVTKAFTALRNEFGKLITETGTKTAALVSQLNGSLTVFGRTLYESARPAIEWVLEKLVQVANIITYGIAKMLGKSVDEMKKLSKETTEAGKQAKKATAGFDTIQTLGASSETGLGADFGALTGEIEKETAYLMMILSGAALVLGVILAFSGVNIPLGIGLIVLGAVGLAASIAASWGTMDQKTKDTIRGVMAIGGAFFLILGLILILTGAGIPLGIGLILLGAGMLYGAYKLTPGDDFVEKVKNLWSKVKEVVKNAIKWIRENALDNLLGEGFGQAFEDLFKDVSELCDDIVALFSNLIEGDLEGVGKSLLNILVDLINIIVDALNLVWQFSLQSIKNSALNWGKIFKYFGAPDISDKINEGFKITEKWLIPHVPKLATGAVLPGGSPMLAWVNDQPKGQPYVEGSIDNIAAAFEKYLGNKAFGNPKFTITAKGSMAQLIRLLALEITEEQDRVSVF